MKEIGNNFQMENTNVSFVLTAESGSSERGTGVDEKGSIDGLSHLLFSELS